MGAAPSYPNGDRAIADYTNVLNHFTTSRLVFDDYTLPEQIRTQTESFLQLYSRCVDGGKIEPEQEEYARFAAKVTDLYLGLDQYLQRGVRTSPADTVAAFTRDFSTVSCSLLTCLKGANSALSALLSSILPAFYARCCIEIGLFTNSLSITRTRSAPFYSLRLIPVYGLYDRVMRCDRRFGNVVAPHNFGKTYSIPLMVMSRMCEEKLVRPFLIVVQRDGLLIPRLKEFYASASADSIQIAGTVGEFVKWVKGKPRDLCVGVFTTVQTLEMLSLIEDKSQLFTRCRFILDDMHKRSLETDVLISQLQRDVLKFCPRERIPGHVYLMSATPDDQLIRYIGGSNVDQIETPFRPVYRVDVRRIAAPNATSVTRKQALVEAINILKGWGAERPEIAPGSMIIFLPGESICARVAEKLRSQFDAKPITTARPVVSVCVALDQRDTAASYFKKVTDKIEELKTERAYTTPPLFFVVIVVTRHFKEASLEIVTSDLPGTLGGSLVRVVIVQEEGPALRVPGVAAVIDSGLQELEFFDAESGSAEVRECFIPERYVQERANLVGFSCPGIAVRFDVAGAVRPPIEPPEVHRVNLARPCLRLWRYKITFSNLKNLPNEPKYELIESAQREFGLLQIADGPFGDAVARFAFLGPVHAASVARFAAKFAGDKSAPLFAFVIFYIIENAPSLIFDNSSEAFARHFCAESDVVTVFSALLPLLKDAVIDSEGAVYRDGFQPAFVHEIRGLVAELAGSPVQTAAADLGAWVGRQAGKALGAVDGLFGCVRETDGRWEARHKSTFQLVLGAGPESRPYLQYRNGRRTIEVPTRPGGWA
jgi:hypothetical protein